MIAGVDGWRGRWVIVTTRPLAIDVVDDLGPLVEATRRREIAVAAVDMPIGLLDDRPRACDVEARAMLGPRRSSIFPAPVRATLAADDYRHACELSRAASGKALSKQAFNLLPAIGHLDELLTPDDAGRVVEASPECAFARMADGEPLPPKRDARGRQRRIGLLTAALGPDLEALLDGPAPIEDVLDAAALVVTARHVVEGTHHLLGGEVDATGKLACGYY